MSIVYLKSEDDLKQLVSNKDTLVLVDCLAKWCGPCRVLSKHFETLSVKWRNDYGDNVVIAKMDVDDSVFATFCTINKVEALPTILFVKGDDVLHRVVGCKVAEITNTVENLMAKKDNNNSLSD